MEPSLVKNYYFFDIKWFPYDFMVPVKTDGYTDIRATSKFCIIGTASYPKEPTLISDRSEIEKYIQKIEKFIEKRNVYFIFTQYEGKRKGVGWYENIGGTHLPPQFSDAQMYAPRFGLPLLDQDTSPIWISDSEFDAAFMSVCETCNANVGHYCTTKSGAKTKNHKAREKKVNGPIFVGKNRSGKGQYFVFQGEVYLSKSKDSTKLLTQEKTSPDRNSSSARERIPDDVQIFVWKRDGGQCVKCGTNQNLAFDHIIPFSKGGSNTRRNLQILCDSCNSKKGNKIGG